MSTAASTELITTEQLLEMPDDGIERWIIRGELREGGMTRRNRRHSRIEINIGSLLQEWLRTQPLPRGELLGGEAGFILSKEPENTVGIDVAYISAHTAEMNNDDVPLVDGPPVLAVEILSPSDQQRHITEKIQTYLDSGVALVWIVEPIFRTVTVYRPGEEPVLFNMTQELTAEPHLPGFRTAVSAIFQR